MEYSYNARCPAVKRLLKEAQELHEATEEYFAQPLEDNLFEWHFTVRGPPDTEFDGGIYHGRIILPPEYPMKPPNIIFFTANGRFETNKKICLSISGHHPESWQPSWSIRTALLAIIGFMPTPASGTIGALDYSAAERKTLATRSAEFECTTCGKVQNLLKERTGNNKEIQMEAREVSAQMTVTEKKIDVESNASDTAKDKSNISDNKSDEIASGSPETSSINERVPTSELNTSDTSSNPVPNTPSSISTSQIRSIQANSSFSLSLMANNIILSGAAMLLVALILRRFFLLDNDIVEDVEDIVS